MSSKNQKIYYVSVVFMHLFLITSLKVAPNAINHNDLVIEIGVN